MKKNQEQIQFGSIHQLLPTSWKNGAGTTKQIAIEPTDAKIEKNDFLWRLSTAEIKKSSEFSIFPHMQRLLCIIGGNELTLKSEWENVLLRQGEIFSFSGDEAIKCDLPSGEVQDIGIIYQKNKVDAKMSYLQFSKKPRSFQLTSKQIFIINIFGELKISSYPGEHTYTLKKMDYLQIFKKDMEENIILCESTTPETQVIAVEINS